MESNLAAELGYRYFGAQVLLDIVYIYIYIWYIIYIIIYIYIFEYKYASVFWCIDDGMMYFPCSISILLRFSYCKGSEVCAAPRVLEHFGRVQEDVKAVEVLCRNSDRYNRPKTSPEEDCTCLKMLKPSKTTTNKVLLFFDACRNIHKYNIYIYNIYIYINVISLILILFYCTW